jgi:hypothetical protein
MPAHLCSHNVAEPIGTYLDRDLPVARLDADLVRALPEALG